MPLGGRYQSLPVEAQLWESQGHQVVVEDREVGQRWLRLVLVGLGVVALAVVGYLSPGATSHLPSSVLRRLSLGKEDDGLSSSAPTHFQAHQQDTGHVARRTVSTGHHHSSSHTMYTDEALADEVTALPGLKDRINFRQFAGYLPITKSKKIFYWFVESETDPMTAPVTLWTNGGPGCSGLFGFMTENGPFRVTKTGTTLTLNPYRWNKVSNMIFVEIPVGVGFSKSSNQDDYNTGDNQTAIDNYLLVQAFFDRFPHLRENEFYLTSESYGGHYLPMLAKRIITKNQEGSNELINLQGFAVGNPFTDPVENVVGMFDTLWGHQLVPQDMYENWVDMCESVGTVEALSSDTCYNLETEMFSMMGDVDPYALDYPVCHADTSSKEKTLALQSGRNQRRRMVSHARKSYLQVKDRSNWDDLLKGNNNNNGFEACEEVYASLYLNSAEVKEAIHADKSIKWLDCSTDLNYKAEDENVFMEPYYKYFVEKYKKLRILVYSGDNDSICATRGTQYWIDQMDWTALSDWTTWKVDDQLAGYYKKYENGFTFATVHGAGHEVPTYKPAAALDLFSKYLRGVF